MSYILDALLKADKERKGHAPPTLHSDHATAPVPRATLARHWTNPAALVLLSGCLLLAGWLIGTKLTAPQSTRSAASPARVDNQPAAAIPPVAAIVNKEKTPPSSAAAMPSAPPIPVKKAEAAINTTVEPAPAAKQPTHAKAAQPVKPARQKRPTQPAPSPEETSRDAQTTPVATAEPKPSSRVMDISALPNTLRKEVESQLTISGYSQASDGQEAMAIINDRARRVGESFGPGMKLEAISPDGIVIAYKGYRFRTRP